MIELKKNYFTSPLGCVITWFCKLSNTTVSFSKLPSFTKSQRVTWSTWDQRPCNVGFSNLTPLRSLSPWQGCWHWPTPQLVPPPLHLSNLVADHLPKRNLLSKMKFASNGCELFDMFFKWKFAFSMYWVMASALPIPVSSFQAFHLDFSVSW